MATPARHKSRFSKIFDTEVVFDARIHIKSASKHTSQNVVNPLAAVGEAHPSPVESLQPLGSTLGRMQTAHLSASRHQVISLQMNNPLRLAKTFVIAMLCPFIAQTGCAHVASGEYGISLDARGEASPAEDQAAKLRISAGEKTRMSSPYFGQLEFTFENPTGEWITVERVSLDFGSEKNNQSVLFPWGARLENWTAATVQRNAVRDINNALALELLAVGGSVAGSAAGRHAPAARAAGGFATLAAMTALTATRAEARADAAENVPFFEGSHLFNVPFDVPPGLFVKRWLVVNTPADPTLGCLTNVVMTYEFSDKTSHRIALAFRNPAALGGEWQARVCAPQRPDRL